MLKKIALIILSLALFPSFAEARDVGFFGVTDIYYESPIWSKDGSRIFYIKTVERVKPTWALSGWPNEYTAKLECYIMSMRQDGSDKKVITKFITKEGSLKYVHNLTVSPDEKVLIFYISAGEESGIYKININGAGLEKIVNFEVFVQGTPFFLSPDGKKIAYIKGRWALDGCWGSHESCWVVDLNGQNNHMIYGEESLVKGWTIDGKIIISPLGGYHLVVYDTELQKVIKEISYSPYSGRPDDYPSSLRMLNIVREKTDVSPDGKKEIFGGTEEIGIMDIDGKNKKILLKGKVH